MTYFYVEWSVKP